MNGDQILNAFEAAWRAGKTPQLGDFLPEDSADRLLLLIELVHLDLEFRLKRGEAARIEPYLETYPELAEDAESLVDFLAAEFRLRCRVEPDLELAEFARRFPQVATRLANHLRGPATFKLKLSARATLASPPDPASNAQPPALAGCEVLREIGRGGMGVVYLARQKAHGRLVAVKMIHPLLHADKTDRNRFQTEILAAARLRHPNIVQLYEVGDAAGQPYCILEYLEGGSLADRLQGVPLPAARAAALVEPLARAMQHAHEQGIVHRDLKPANILLARVGNSSPPVNGATKDGGPPAGGFDPAVVVPKVADFGLAKFIEGHADLTRTGEILGTVSYMAPEQAGGRTGTVGPAADVYALGAILYETLTGRPPFQGESALDTLEQVRSQDAVPPSRLQPRMPRDLETICLKCLRKEPGKRYATAGALADDLQRFREGRPVLARPTAWWEKAGKWCARQPLTAAALGALVLALVLGVSGITWKWREAVTRTDEAVIARDSAKRQHGLAVRRLYFNQIARAQQAVLSGRLLEAERILLSCEADSPELCRWEWHYLKRMCHSARQTFRGHDNDVRGLAVTPDGRRIISASGLWFAEQVPGHVIVWDALTGERLHDLPDAGASVHQVAVHSDGRRVATGGADGTARLWDLNDPRAAPRVLEHGKGNTVFSVTFSPAGDRLATGCFDRKVHIWDLKTLRELPPLAGHKEGVFAVAYSPDGKWLVSAGRDGLVIVRDAATFKVNRTFQMTTSAMAVAFSPDGRRLAVGTFSGLIRVWDLQDVNAPVWTRSTDYGHICDLAFSPDGRSLGWCKSKQGAHVVDLATGEMETEFRGHDNGVQRLAFSRDGHTLLTGGGDGVVRGWDLIADREPLDFTAHTAFLYQFAYRPDGKYLALPGGFNQSSPGLPRSENTLVLLSVAGDERPQVFKGRDDWLTCVGYRPDGRQIATGAEDKTVLLRDASSGAVQHTLKDHEGAVTGVAYTGDGRFLLSGCADQRLRQWDVETGTLQRVFTDHTGSVTAVVCSPAGPFAASASADQTVRLWDLEKGILVREFPCPTGAAAVGVAFAPDGNLLACAFADWTVRIYEVATGRETTPADKPIRLAVRFPPGGRKASQRGNWHTAIALGFSPDGQRLVSAAPNCSVQVWDVESGQEALALPHQSSSFLWAAFSPDGTTLTATYASSVVHWDASPRPAVPDPTPAKDAWDWHDGRYNQAEKDEDLFALSFHSAHLQVLQPDRVINWQRHAIARLGLEDAAGHHQVCSDMIRHFAATDDAATASVVGHACALDPEAGGRPEALVALARRAIPAGGGNERVFGAALYRAGDADGALEQFKKGADDGRRAWDFYFLAMIHQRLAHAAEAQANYAEGRRRQGDDRPVDWKERIEVQTLQREAERRLQDK